MYKLFLLSTCKHNITSLSLLVGTTVDACIYYIFIVGSLPIIDESYTRPDSDTPSNDSGSALTDEDLPVTEPRKFSPCDLMSSEARNFSPSNLISDPKMWTYDLLAGRVPSNVPSPNILPELFSNSPDLMNFESPSGTVLPAKSDSDVMFCLHHYQGLIINRHLCINTICRIVLIHK